MLTSSVLRLAALALLTGGAAAQDCDAYMPPQKCDAPDACYNPAECQCGAYPQVQCFADPCQMAECRDGYRCEGNYCGGCNHMCVPEGGPPREECRDGETKMDDCNTCKCAGGQWGCTRMLCPKTEAPEPTAIVDPVPPREECRDGETKMDDCNTCKCAGGQWGCTRMLCPKTEAPEPTAIVDPVPPRECRDGERKKLDCNECGCSNGMWVCTEMACPPTNAPAPTIIIDPVPCSEYNPPQMCGAAEDCYNPKECKCGVYPQSLCLADPCAGVQCRDGYQCLMSSCGGCHHICVPDEPKPECRDGDQKKMDCNTCFCSGGHWACTLMACPAQCRDGDTKMEDCNTCKCANGRWGCTKMLCPPPVAECRAGELKKEDCNTCKCADGKWACTKRMCPPTVAPEPTAIVDPVPPQCRDGDTKMENCNRCFCNAGRWGCTKRACVPPPVPTAVVECTPYTEPLTCPAAALARGECYNPAECQCGAYPQVQCFADPCQMAECRDGYRCEGNYCGGCNHMCVPEGGPPREECRDGETKMDDCNTCKCAGGQWGCTRMLCPKTEAPEPTAIVDPVPPREECRDGETKMDDCNECGCSNGMWVCTEMVCPPTNAPEPTAIVDPVPPREECRDGETKMDDCNRCRCAGGRWGCTRMMCQQLREGDVCRSGGVESGGITVNRTHACPPGTLCIPDESFAIGGEVNWTCVAEADIARGNATGRECRLGHTKQVACNTCRCNTRGLWSCTKRACPDDKPLRVGSKCTGREDACPAGTACEALPTESWVADTLRVCRANRTQADVYCDATQAWVATWPRAQREFCCEAKQIGCADQKVNAAKKRCRTDTADATTRRRCCQAFGMQCTHDKFDCFDGARDAWSPAQEKWCCRMKNVCPRLACDVDVQRRNATAAVQCCALLGRCAVETVVRGRVANVNGTVPTTRREKIMQKWRAANTTASRKPIRRVFQGDSEALWENPLYVLGRVRRAMLAASSSMAAEDLVVRAVGVVGAEAHWAVNFTLAMNAEAAEAEEAAAAMDLQRRGAGVLQVAAAGVAGDDLWVTADLVAPGVEADVLLEDLETVTADESAHVDYFPVRLGATGDEEGDDDHLKWAIPLAAVGSLMCVGSLIVLGVMTRKRGLKDVDHLNASRASSDTLTINRERTQELMTHERNVSIMSDAAPVL